MTDLKMFVVPAGKTLEESPEVQQQIALAEAAGWKFSSAGRGGDGRILLYYSHPKEPASKESSDSR